MTRSRRFALALVSLWAGAMIMMSTVASPVFTVVGQEQGGQIMRRIFPAYYFASLAVPLIAMLITFPRARREPSGVARLVILGLAFAVAAWNFFVVTPGLAAHRVAMHEAGAAADPAAIEAFGRLHVQSVGLLASLILLALVYAGMEILARPGPNPPRH